LYYENLLTSLGLAGHLESVVVIEPEGGSFAIRTQAKFPSVRIVDYRLPPVRATIARRIGNLARRRLGLHDPALRGAMRRSQADVVFGHMDVTRRPPLPWVGWIPDFQHIHYPDYFSVEDAAGRDSTFEMMATKAALTVLSSQDAYQDFVTFAPQLASKGRVVPFVSLFPDAVYEDDPLRVARAFHVQRPYVVVPNQWWRHKNHETAIRAAALLRDHGLDLHWIMTGALNEPRALHHNYISDLLQLIASLDLSTTISILGVLPRAEQSNLMRGAMCIVQPSLFEGWSTVVEDAKSLGQRIAVSDIPVHREQNPPASTFFRPLFPEELAAAVERILSDPEPTDPGAARRDALERALRYGESFYRVCEEAAGAGTDSKARQRRAENPLAS
jgi:glycosyltransferase involved in cell wall biosynthesis